MSLSLFRFVILLIALIDGTKLVSGADTWTDWRIDQIREASSNRAPPLWWHRKKIVNVTGDPGVGLGWADSYSYKGTHCYCMSTFDHNIGTVIVDTPFGKKTIKEVCDLLGPGPGSKGRPVYNDIQCGNGPPNDAGDEQKCPGRVDHGIRGCKSVGPKWNFTGIQS